MTITAEDENSTHSENTGLVVQHSLPTELNIHDQ